MFDIRRGSDKPIDSEEFLLALERPDFQKAVGARPTKDINKCNRSRVVKLFAYF